MSDIAKVRDLSFGYSPAQPILRSLSFEVEQGSFLAIAGPNGAGKTTLLNLLCGLLRTKTGSVRIDGELVESYPAKALAMKIAVVRQQSVPVFDFSVTEVVAMARTPYLGTFGFETTNDTQLVTQALEMTEVSRFAHRTLAQLSGGERQRVFIARAIAQDTPILLLDEPTSSLDMKHQVGIFDLLKRLQAEKAKTIIAVTHDINLAAQYCDRALLLGSDCSCWHGSSSEVLTAERIEKVFGVECLIGTAGKHSFLVPVGKYTKKSEQADN